MRAWRNVRTQYGFQFGAMDVKRLASNGGADSRAMWSMLEIEADGGKVIVTCDRRGNLTLQTTPAVRIEEATI